MHKKTKSPLDGVVVSDYILQMLFILFTLFTLHSSLLAKNISSKEDNATARVDKYNSIGERYYNVGKYDKALESFEKALKIDIATIGENNPNIASDYSNIGLVWQSQEEYDKAIKFYNKALKIRLSTLGEKHPQTAISYGNIGSVWKNKGEYDKAIEFYNKALKIILSTLGEKHLKAIILYKDIGSVWENKGEYEKAIEFYNKALISLANVRVSHPYITITHDSLALTFNRLASFYRDKKEYQKAIKYYMRALFLHKKIIRANSSYSNKVLVDIENIIKTHQENNNSQKAKEIYIKALGYYTELFKKYKIEAYGLNYVRIIIKGVDEFDLDKDELEKAKSILATFPKNSTTKGLQLQIEELEGSIDLYIWAFMILSLLGLIFYIKRYKNPLVVKLTEDPSSLKRLNAQQLKEAEERLNKINRLESTLALANVSKKEFDNALAFYAGTKEEKAEIFSQKIKRSTLNKDAEFFKLNCRKSDLSVDDFMLYFTTQRAEEVEEQLRERGDRVFVISSGEEQEKMVKLGHEKTNNIIACSEQELSEFLLSSKAENEFMKILSECLEFSSISLYQTSGGLQKENDFFGRIKIVRDIKMNSKYNYMIVGGRQLGKSSILRKLHRSYATSSTVDCRFINLEGKKGELIRALAENFALSERAGLEDVLAYVRQSKKKMLLLIDEVDEFVEPEQANDYETLKALKNLAEEGKANFVLAGYWTLYQYITADYQSPLYNFGELIVLEGLEKKACRELMAEPMKRIGVSYEDEASLDEVIELCGQRANLIATVCDEVLKIQETKNISAKALKNALQSQAVDAKLEGWDNIDSYNDRNSRIDRIVILVSVEKEQFELDEVLSLFKELGAEVDASEIKKSLERLVIAYVLQKEGAVFSFRVPLMKAHILKTNEKGRKALLEEEITKLSSNN